MFYISSVVKQIKDTKKTSKKPPIKKLHHIAKMIIVPHKNNNFNPHLVRYYNIITVIITIICLQLAYNGYLTGEAFQLKNNITVSDLLQQTNKTRRSYNVGELKLSDKLCEAANKKAQNMFDDQYWSHVSPSGVQPWQWLNDIDYNYNEAGENLAKSFTSTSAVMTAWMNSPGHKSNILNDDFTEVGFAVVNGKLNNKKTSLVVAFYGTPSTASNLDSIKKFSQPISKNNNILVHIIIAVQSASSIVMAGIIYIIIVIIILSISQSILSCSTKTYRKKWYKNITIYIIASLILFCIFVLSLFSNGQI